MRSIDVFAIAVAAVIALLSLIVEPWSALWWGALSLASLIALLAAGHILFNALHGTTKGEIRLGMIFVYTGFGVMIFGAALGFRGAWMADSEKLNEDHPRDCLYFSADIGDGTNSSSIPLMLSNTSVGPFMNVVAWFSPASAKGVPDPPTGPYWSLAHLKYQNSVQQGGAYRSGQFVPLGYYRIEIIANKDKSDKSVDFTELLELRVFNGKVVQLIDLWAGGRQGTGKLYTSPRPDELRDNRTPQNP